MRVAFPVQKDSIVDGVKVLVGCCDYGLYWMKVEDWEAVMIWA